MGRKFYLLMVCTILSMDASHPSIKNLSFFQKSNLIKSTVLNYKNTPNKTLTLLFYDPVTGRTRIKVTTKSLNPSQCTTYFFDYYS